MALCCGRRPACGSLSDRSQVEPSGAIDIATALPPAPNTTLPRPGALLYALGTSAGRDIASFTMVTPANLQNRRRSFVTSP